MDWPLAWQHWKRGARALVAIGLFAVAALLISALGVGLLFLVLEMLLPQAQRADFEDVYMVPWVIAVAAVFFPYIFSTSYERFEEFVGKNPNERVPSTPASVADRTANKTAAQIALDEHIKKTSAYLRKLWPSSEEIARLRHAEPMITNTKKGWDKVFEIIAIVFIITVILAFLGYLIPFALPEIATGIHN